MKKASSKRALRPAPSEESVSPSGTAETGTEGERSRVPWVPRPYQQEALDQFKHGRRRQILIWHRRAGKDNFAMNLAAEQMRQQVGTYWHLYPSHVQARRAIWNGIDKRGHRFIDLAFDPADRETTRNQDMQIVTKGGAMWQLAGSDRYDSLVGSNPLGVVFSEFALCDPRAWDYVRPIIRENGGWVVFITTYRGRNHAYRMFHRLNGRDGWYCDLRTIEDTTDQDGNRIITDEDIADERAEGMSEALIRQEYYCDPVAAQAGAVYGRQMAALVEGGRLQSLGYDRALPVLASWSIEPSQHTVSFFQRRGNELRVIGSQSFRFESLSDAIKLSRERFPWRLISRDIVSASATSEALKTFEDFGAVVEVGAEMVNPFDVTRDCIGRMYVDNAVRTFSDDDENNARLVDALNGYRFKEQTGGQSYSSQPALTWEAHYARTVETFAAYDDDQPETNGGWFPAASYEQHDRAVI